MSVVFDYQVEASPEAGTIRHATVSSIRELRAKDVFKSKARDPEQMLIAIYGKLDDWEGRIGTFEKPSSKLISPTTRLARFWHRYKKFPEIGMMVEVVANERGYWNITI